VASFLRKGGVTCDFIGKKWNGTQQKILVLLPGDARSGAAHMAGQIGITRRNIESNLKKLGTDPARVTWT
jgi:hypothetical protein